MFKRENVFIMTDTKRYDICGYYCDTEIKLPARVSCQKGKTRKREEYECYKFRQLNYADSISLKKDDRRK